MAIWKVHLSYLFRWIHFHKCIQCFRISHRKHSSAFFASAEQKNVLSLFRIARFWTSGPWELSTQVFKPCKGILVHFSYANLGMWSGFIFHFLWNLEISAYQNLIQEYESGLVRMQHIHQYLLLFVCFQIKQVLKQK